MTKETNLEDLQDTRMFVAAEGVFDETVDFITVLRLELADAIRAGGTAKSAELLSYLKQVNATLSTALKERQKLDEIRRNAEGGTGGFVLDLGAARAEVCERLDKLAAAG